ncbi:MAG TPA: hypothetical protein DC047_12080 [Blastocatellia bacterium]|nr:hypothetical protein [Blastocatellia bacterium]
MTFSIEQLADEIEHALEEHYYRTSTEPSGYEYMRINEFGDDWERKGYPIADVIADCAEITADSAEDIRSVLFDRHDDFELATMGEENPFDEEAQYEETEDVDDAESQAGWAHFEKSLKTEGRYFNRSAEATLASLFEGLAEHKAAEGRPIIVEAGPAMPMDAVYRARVFQSDEKLEEALKNPIKEVGPPPSLAAANGRMNAHGIAVFYGATDPVIALVEVRPPVGSKVVVGKFELIRVVRLLDIEALQSLYVEGSIFDRDYLHRLERAKFLRWLSEQMTLPVMPGDEPFGYLATQAIADFLATEASPPLDGILYPSVQGTEAKLNVVLFHKASRVEALKTPEGTEISVYISYPADEGDEIDYSVSEEVPAVISSAPDTTDPGPVLFIPAGLKAFTPEEYDSRDVTLKLDVSSLEVHHVTGLTIKTEPHSVSRHRFEKRSDF